MKRAWLVVLLFLSNEVFSHSHIAIADTADYVPTYRISADIGTDILGYKGALRDAYGVPASLTLGIRMGQVDGKWTAGLRASQKIHEDYWFRGEYFFDGQVQPVNVHCMQRHTLWNLDLRRDFWNHRRITPFVDAGLQFSRMIAFMSIHDPRPAPRSDEEPLIRRIDLHRDLSRRFVLGTGFRVNLFSLENRGGNSRLNTSDYAFLEFRIGYLFGNSTSFLQIREGNGTRFTRPQDIDTLRARPSIHAPIDSFFLGITLGFHITS